MAIVVFVGSESRLPIVRPMQRIFERNGWVTQECTSVAEAMRKKPNVMVIYASGHDYVADFNGWTDYPPLIWICYSRKDVIPAGTKPLRPPIRPTRLFEECQKLLFQ